jgi:hypothetical protein
MSGLRATVALVALIVLAGCTSPSATAVPSAVASAAARASIAVPAGTIPPKGAAGIVAPVRAGQTLTVLNGYDNPMPDKTCDAGSVHDHCANQQYALDLVPSDPDDLLVLSPVSGTIAWQDVVPKAGQTAKPSGCIGIVPTAFTELNLTVCHLSEVRAPSAVKAGEVLGLRRASDPWVHMNLDVRKDAKGPLPRDKWTAVAFSGAFTIAGKDFAPASSPDPDRHSCASFTSATKATGETAQPNPKPVVKTADLSKCGIAAAKPTPTPTPKPVAAAPNPYGDNRTEIFKRIRSQAKKDIERPSLKDVEAATRKLLQPKYAATVATYRVGKSSYFTADLVDSEFREMTGKTDGFRRFMDGYTSRDRALEGYREAGISVLIPMLLAVCRASGDPAIQRLAYEAAETAWEYGITIEGNAKTKVNAMTQDFIDFNPDW